jgi:hypothetical protein
MFFVALALFKMKLNLCLEELMRGIGIYVNLIPLDSLGLKKIHQLP